MKINKKASDESPPGHSDYIATSFMGAVIPNFAPPDPVQVVRNAVFRRRMG
jgi:hypothetical protein